MNGVQAGLTAAPAEACSTLADVRAGIDEVDLRIVDLLALRQTYAVRAARLKTDRATVRDEKRIAQLVANAVAYGVERGLPADLVETIWHTMIEQFDIHALRAFDAAQAAKEP